MENQYLNFWGYLSQWKWLLVWGIISLLVGIYFAFQPSQAYLFIASLFGISLLVGGIFQMMTATNDRDVNVNKELFELLFANKLKFDLSKLPLPEF